jgi:hypothetical protein
MRPTAKRYNTNYKKHVDTEKDPYILRRSAKGVIQCSGCGCFYYRRRWNLTPPSEGVTPAQFQPGFCPACRKIKDKYPLGELHLLGVESGDRQEVFRILRNEEEQAREKNPMERIMRLEAKNGGWRVETTTEKLAQRLGRSLKKARGGKVAYQWSHNNKFVRVFWDKREA